MKKQISVICLFLAVAIGSVELYRLEQAIWNRNVKGKLLETRSEIKGNFVEKEKTVIDVYKYLKNKGWNLDGVGEVDIPPFNSKKAIGFRVKLLNVNAPRVFLVMQYSSTEIAKANFAKIEQIYKNKFGGAILMQNLIVVFFGGDKCQLEPTLSEEYIVLLRQHLIEFFTFYDQTILSKSIKK